MILVLDNYDSFTYNLVQYLGELGCEVEVSRNDAITVTEVVSLEPTHIVISPGPCTPNEAGISLELVEKLSGRIPILGVCLGHQAIGQAFGGRIEHARAVMHGKTSVVEHDGRGVFAGLPGRFTATRYHSLVVAPESVPDCLEVSAWCDDGQGNVEVMGLRHLEFAVEGVQFHPESILTEHGSALLKNFLAA